MGVRRRQTFRLAETCLTLRGKMVILVSKINKNQFLYIFVVVENLTIYRHNLYAFFSKKQNKKKPMDQKCAVTPVVTVFILYDYLQYHTKQKCTVPQCSTSRFAMCSAAQCNAVTSNNRWLTLLATPSLLSSHKTPNSSLLPQHPNIWKSLKQTGHQDGSAGWLYFLFALGPCLF